jgi:hypothetical protein
MSRGAQRSPNHALATRLQPCICEDAVSKHDAPHPHQEATRKGVRSAQKSLDLTFCPRGLRWSAVVTRLGVAHSRGFVLVPRDAQLVAPCRGQSARTSFADSVWRQTVTSSAPSPSPHRRCASPSLYTRVLLCLHPRFTPEVLILGWDDSACRQLKKLPPARARHGERGVAWRSSPPPARTSACVRLARSGPCERPRPCATPQRGLWTQARAAA